MKPIFFLISIFSTYAIMAQIVVQGKVVDSSHQPLIAATILELGTSNGVITDAEGTFTLSLRAVDSRLVVSYTGFESDTLRIDQKAHLHIVLKENAATLDEVVVKTSSSFFDELESRQVEVITEAELTKAACCNLSESFETNASVDASFSDAVSGTKTIQMLGMDGRYVQINRENIPNIRGLLGRYGLSFIPGTWIQAIDVGKGAGSVVNGYESMTGQINVELKKPEMSEMLYLNTYANSFGRVEVNANHARRISDKWSGGILFHANTFNNELDQNKDGFMDLPKGRQANLMSRFKYEGERWVSQWGMTALIDEKAGGQLGFGFKDNAQTAVPYGFSNRTTRLELFGKTGLLFPQQPYKGWGFIYSGSYLKMETDFGRKGYQGVEKTLYGNVIYQNLIGNSFHQYKTGVSFLYDSFDEIYVDSAFSRIESVPGLYYEYTFAPNDRFTLLAGARGDFHNLYGLFFTPRLHTRVQLAPTTTLRAAIGRGYRVPNALIESSKFLISSREWVVEEAPNPEISWNMGGSLVTEINVAGKKLNLIADYFYTTFENQLVLDMNQSARALHVYNLGGPSRAHSLQLEARTQLTDFVSLKGAYKFYDVRMTINDKFRQVPFNARNRFFLNVSYATKYDKWEVDYTLNGYGRKRLPSTLENPPEQQRPSFSPHYLLANAQMTRNFRWGSVYLGGENIFDFTQNDPIIDAQNPFSEEGLFDTSFVWAPVAGRMIYVGFRYKLKAKNEK